MELILVVVINAGMAGNSQNGVSRSLTISTDNIDEQIRCEIHALLL